VKTANKDINRRTFLLGIGRYSLLGVLGLFGLALGRGVRRAKGEEYVWQIDPEKCTQCGRCATACVLSPSAVKCVHAYAVCGYCNLCGGFHQPNTKAPDTAAENQLCPTSALRRRFIEDPYYQYDVVEALCIGCGKCVKGCGSFGNGSLFLQVRHDRCSNCNECAIARQCPGEAFSRVPRSQPYRLRGGAA
jgi:electron transport complex protein RnfB